MLTRRTALALMSGASALPCLTEGNADVVELPARLNRNNQILVPVSVNRRGLLWCLFDTGGADLLYLRAAKAVEMGIGGTSTVESSGALDTAAVTGGRALVTIDVGTFHREKQEIYIKDYLSRDEGIIGAAIFADSIVELDFRAPAVRLHSPASFHYWGTGALMQCDLWSFNPHISASFTIGDGPPVKARVALDSGAGGKADAFVTPRFNERLRNQGRKIPWVVEQDGFSTCRIRRMAVGPLVMENALIVMMPVQGFGGDAQAPDGMLAVNFLRRYRIYIDYGRTQVILELA